MAKNVQVKSEMLTAMPRMQNAIFNLNSACKCSFHVEQNLTGSSVQAFPSKKSSC